VYELHLQKKGGTVYIHHVGVMPVQIGRAPNNDLVLSDPMVSQQHAVVWVQDGKLHVRDLASRNGVFVGDDRVVGTSEVVDNASLKIGPDISMRAVRTGPTGTELGIGFVVEDETTGIVVPVAFDRFYVGSAQESDLLIEESAERAATLLVHDNGEVWLGTDDEERQIAVDESFKVGAHILTLRAGDALQAPTAQPRNDRYPYSIVATLSGATGPEATVRNVASGHEYKVDAENRAILLYLLARQVQRDREEGLPPGDIGWATDDDVRLGVWGRGAGEDNKLHVLVYRLRNELKKAGFDPWFIEKRRKYIRARIAGAEIG
jgi:hypothetical protein